MKYPSLLKIPSHKRFNFKNRYYDPIKEDIENRTEVIKAQMERRKLENPEDSSRVSKISGSFSHNSYYKEGKSGMLRFSLIALLFFGSIGYLYLGNVVLYISAGLIILIYYLRKRQMI